jgi:hypothetical protein
MLGFAAITLTGVRDNAMAVRLGSMSPRRVIDRDTLLVPEVIEQEPRSADYIVRHLVDPVWQASGWERSPNFNDDDVWSPS